MRTIGKTLYLLNNNTHLSVDKDDILVAVNENKTRIPALLIENIVIFGNTTISSYLLKFCDKNNILITFLSEYGTLYGRFCGCENRCIVLKKKQYDLYDTSGSLSVAKNIMLAKFINSKNLILQSAKDCDDVYKKDLLINIANKISEQKSLLFSCNSHEQLLGIEGSVAQDYFSVFDFMIKAKDKSMMFDKRSRRPPLNNCNALLSFFYVLFCNDITAAVESVGLDSYLGYYHRLHPGRQSLSLDILEEFRQSVVDRFVLNVINNNQVTSKDFDASNGVKLTDSGRKRCIELWENFKSTPVRHKFYNKDIEIKLLPYVQAQLLAQFIRGDIGEYPPFIR